MNIYIGVDPGPSTGIVVLVFDDELNDVEWYVYQVSDNAALLLLGDLCRQWSPRVVSYEEFVPSNRAGNKGKDADTTRRIAGQVETTAMGFSHRIPKTFIVARKAADVKPWATDKRLEKLKFPMGAKFKDARDAARHALYAAVRDGKERDPLA